MHKEIINKPMFVDSSFSNHNFLNIIGQAVEKWRLLGLVFVGVQWSEYTSLSLTICLIKRPMLWKEYKSTALYWVQLFKGVPSRMCPMWSMQAGNIPTWIRQGRLWYGSTLFLFDNPPSWYKFSALSTCWQPMFAREISFGRKLWDC